MIEFLDGLRQGGQDIFGLLLGTPREAARFADNAAYMALLVAAISATGWFLKEFIKATAAGIAYVVRKVDHWSERRNLRKEVIRSLYVDVSLFVRDKEEEKKAEDELRAKGEDPREPLRKVIRDTEYRGGTFRAYVIEITDELAMSRFKAIVHRMPGDVIVAFQRFHLTHGLYVRQYRGLKSDEFANLSAERKINVVDDHCRVRDDALETAQTLLKVLRSSSKNLNAIKID